MKTKPNVALLSRNEERLVRMGLWELLGTSRLTNTNEIETAVALWKHFGGNADAFKVGTRDK
jgi:hypothetical protein